MCVYDFCCSFSKWPMEGEFLKGIPPSHQKSPTGRLGLFFPQLMRKHISKDLPPLKISNYSDISDICHPISVRVLDVLVIQLRTVNMLMTEAILVPCAVLAVEASFPGAVRLKTYLEQDSSGESCWISGCFKGKGMKYYATRRWWFQLIFFIFTPNLGEDEPNLTSICFNWVGSTTT